jgi:glycosyltransferase involved in cell wall biosynthesis
MKILILEDNADVNFGGAEKSMFEFVEFLSRNENQIYLACGVYKYPQNDYVKAILNLKTSALEARSAGHFLRNLRLLVSFINEHKIDVIITHTIHNFPLLRITKVLTNVRIVSIFKWVYNQDEIGIKASWGIKGIDNAIFLNEFVSGYWNRFLDLRRTNIELIPDGVQISIKEKNLSKKFKKLLFVGRITEGKGIMVLLNALIKLPNDYTLTIVGDFNPSSNHFHAAIKQFIKENNLSLRVIISGLIQNSVIYDFYDNADLLVVPSIQPEAQPLVIIESIMRNTPVIYSKLGGLEFMVKTTDFWHFESNDANSISRKLIHLSNANNDELIYNFKLMKEEILAVYDIRATHKDLLKLLNSK